MQFDIGRLVARIQVEGAEAFASKLGIASAGWSKLDANGKQAAASLGLSTLAIGAGITVLTALAIKRFADFDHAFSDVRANVQGSVQDYADLRDAALDASQKTVFSASEAASAESSLGKAGVSTAAILGGALAGALSLAAAGQIEVADAADIAATAMTQFKLSGSDVPHIADLLAAGANKAQGSVGDLALGLKQSGLVSAQFGLSLDETVGTLTAFAAAGLLGSDGGTSFRNMLLQLATPSQQQTALLKKYNLQMYDAEGHFVGISALAQNIQTSFAGATDSQRNYALGVIFGSDAIRAANVLYKDGAKGLQDWIDKVNDSGAAARIAATMNDNLTGDVKKLGNAFDVDLIKSGSAANGVLREMVQGLSDALHLYASLPAPVQGAFVEVGLLTGAVLLFGGALLIVVPKIVQFRAAVATLNEQLPQVRAGAGKLASFLAGPWGIALAAAAIGVDVLSQYLDSLQASTQEVTASLTTAKNAQEILATANKGLDVKDFADMTAEAKNLNAALHLFREQDSNPLARFTNDYAQTRDALHKVGTGLASLADASLPAAQSAFRKLAADTDGTRGQLWSLLSTTTDYRTKLIELATEAGDYSETMTDAQKKTVLLNYAQGLGSESAAENADALAALSGKASDATGDISTLAQQIHDFASGTLDARAAERDLLQAVDDATASFKQNGASLDDTTQAGRDNEAALDKIAQAAINAAAATYTQTGSAHAATDEINKGRDALISQLAQFGITGQAAEDYANKLGLAPSDITTLVQLLGTEDAEAKLEKLQASIKRIPTQYGITVSTKGGVEQRGDHGANGMYISRYATGGFAEKHVAQIARAGGTRIWNEPETEGEAYIPLGMSKRSTAEPVLERVASQFGYSLVRNGGAAAPATSGGSSTKGLVIQGTLDLGNGLTGMIRGVVVDTLDHEDTARGNGSLPL